MLTTYTPPPHTPPPSLWQQQQQQNHLYALPNVPGVKAALLLRPSVLNGRRVPSNFYEFLFLQSLANLPAWLTASVNPMGHKWPNCMNLWHLVTNVLSLNSKLPQTTHKCPEHCTSRFLCLAAKDGPIPLLCPQSMTPQLQQHLQDRKHAFRVYRSRKRQIYPFHK